jgi:transposase
MPGQVVSAQPGQPFVDDRVGCGVMGASAIADTVVDPSLFRLGREFAAWPEMTPRQNSSGGEERLGTTSKSGDKYIRRLLIADAVAVLRHARNRPTGDGRGSQILFGELMATRLVYLAMSTLRSGHRTAICTPCFANA